MSDISRGWFVLGWFADVYYDELADLYTATVPRLPQLQATASTKTDALAELHRRIARDVGPNPESCEHVN